MRSDNIWGHTSVKGCLSVKTWLWFGLVWVRVRIRHLVVMCVCSHSNIRQYSTTSVLTP